MSVIVAAEPLLAGATLPDPRPRVVTGLAVPMTGAATANAGSRKPTDRQHERKSGEDAPESAEDDLPPGAMFAAGLVAAALPERPRSIEELWGRPGTAWVAPDSELKLRDISV